jgi:ubiquinone/menaquinone biosynthesis C-methylase UbiE
MGPARQLVSMVDKNDGVRCQDLARLDEIERTRIAVAEQYFAKLAPEWDRLRQLDVDEQQVANAVREMLPLGPSHRLLDLGTGTGRMLQVLGSAVIEAVGVDNSHEMLAVARVNLKRWGLENCTLRQADLMALPLNSGTFDAVVLHQVLHFIKRPWAAIAEALRVLNRNGRLLIVDLAPHNNEDLRDLHAHHRLGFSDSEVREWLADQGFSCETIRHLEGGKHLGGLNVTIWLARHAGPTMIL